MKKILSIIMAIVGLCFVACTEDTDLTNGYESGEIGTEDTDSTGTRIPDGPNVAFTVKIDIQDNEGNSLLNPDADNNIIGSDIYMDYDGTSYDTNWAWNLGWDPNESIIPDSIYRTELEPIIRSRYYLPTFYGLLHLLTCEFGADPGKYKWTILFGEFGGHTAEREMTLHVGDKSYDIKLVTKVELDKKTLKHIIESTTYLDGEVVEGPYVVIKI